MHTWKIDPAHSTVGFKVKHLVVSTVKGTFGTFEGTLTASDDTLQDAKLSFSADIASINTNNAQRDGHMQAADFFDAAQFPKLTFVSKNFIKTERGTFAVMGDLTMKGVTKEVSLNVIFNGIATDAYGKRVASFDVSGTINRMDFGVNWNAALETGGVVASEEVVLDATMECKEE